MANETTISLTAADIIAIWDRNSAYLKQIIAEPDAMKKAGIIADWTAFQDNSPTRDVLDWGYTLDFKKKPAGTIFEVPKIPKPHAPKQKPAGPK